MNEKTDLTEEQRLRIGKRRIILNRYRVYIFKIYGPFYVAFNLVDWLYKPEFAIRWLLYRIFFLFYVFVGLKLLANKKIRQYGLTAIGISPPIVGSWLITIMIADSGGAHSVYVTGLILLTTVFIGLFRLSGYLNILVSFLCFGPAILIIFWSINFLDLRIAFVQSAISNYYCCYKLDRRKE
jgi:hypothetical protein